MGNVIQMSDRTDSQARRRAIAGLVSAERAAHDHAEGIYRRAVEALPSRADLREGRFTIQQAAFCLAQQFPSLAGWCASTNAWDPQSLDEHAAACEPLDGEREAAQFVLSLWNESYPWKCGKFSLGSAMRCWDYEHIAVFRAWAVDPFVL